MNKRDEMAERYVNKHIGPKYADDWDHDQRQAIQIYADGFDAAIEEVLNCITELEQAPGGWTTQGELRNKIKSLKERV